MSEKTIIEQANLTELQATISARQIKRLGKYTHWILLPPIVCVGTAVIFFCLLSRIKMQNFGVPTITPEKMKLYCIFLNLSYSLYQLFV